jgi:hypothetical protein
VDDTLAAFGELRNRKAIHALMQMPSIDIGLSATFRAQALEEYLGEMPRCPNPEIFDLARANVNVCVMGRVWADEDKEGTDGLLDPGLAAAETCGWYVGHFRSVSLRTLRGVSIRRPVNLTPWQMRKGYVPPARDPLMGVKALTINYVGTEVGRLDRGFAFQRFAVTADARHWKMLEPDGHLSGDLKEEQLAKYAYAFEWGNKFLWLVTIRRGFLSVQYHCSARNVLELLWMRSREGRHRRAPLIHLVRPHTRQLASGKTTTVRPHLRGSTSCTWNQWEIDIQPSAHDLDVLARRMLPGQDMLEFIEANCGLLYEPKAEAA